MPTTAAPVAFGPFELDIDAGELRKDGAPVRLAPQPFKLLALLVSHAGQAVTRDQIRSELWSDGTTVDFEQGVNFSVKQVREALADDAEHPRYIQTLPKRGYRFIAPLQSAVQARPRAAGTDVRLQKALWANIAEIRLAQEKRRRVLRTIGAVGAAMLVVLLLLAWLR